jgi:hypothetical protein
MLTHVGVAGGGAGVLLLQSARGRQHGRAREATSGSQDEARRMLLDAVTPPGRLPDETGLRRWEDDRVAFAWKGHLYLPGLAAGAPSVARLAADLAAGEELADAAARLAGVFGLFVHDKASGGWHALVDNAGLFKIFHDARGASTSFLGLVADRRPGLEAVDRSALVEFLAHGAVFVPRTLLKGVGKLAGGEILELPADGSRPRLRPKRLPEALPGDAGIVLEHFRHLALSLEGRALSADASGGFDSRLVACLLHTHGLTFDLATTGQPGTRDTEIARQMADLLGHPFHISGHDLGAMDDAIVATFEAGDGLTDVRRLHRDRQFALDRLGRGVEVIAHGGGGEFFRDHYVIQDFPFYGSPKVNFARYYDLRTQSVALPAASLTPIGRELLADLRPATIARYEAYRSPTNNESYDKLFLHLRGPEHFGQYYANYINMGLDVVAPLMDHRNALVAIATSPWRRFFAGWHRRVLTDHLPRLAALPTAEGFTASAERALMLRDVGAFAATQLRRAGKKASQRLTGRARFHTVGAFVADAPGYMAALLASPHFARSVERLKAVGVLASDETGAGLRPVHVGRALTLGLFLDRVEGSG